MTVSGKRLYLLLAALVALGAMAAVALTERSAQRAGAITSFQVSPLPGEVTYEGGSIRLEVPDKAATPAITPEQAMSTYQQDGAPPGLDKLGGVADVHLAVFSDASYGSYDANGHIIPKYQRALLGDHLPQRRHGSSWSRPHPRLRRGAINYLPEMRRTPVHQRLNRRLHAGNSDLRACTALS